MQTELEYQMEQRCINKAKVAKRMGVNRTTLYNKLSKKRQLKFEEARILAEIMQPFTPERIFQMHLEERH